MDISSSAQLRHRRRHVDLRPRMHTVAPSPGEQPGFLALQQSWLKPAITAKKWFKSSERTIYRILSDPNNKFVINSDWKFSIRKRMEYRGKCIGSKVHKRLFKVIVKLTDSSWRKFYKELLNRRKPIPKTGIRLLDRTRKSYRILLKRKPGMKLPILDYVRPIPPYYLEEFARTGEITTERLYRKKITKYVRGRRTTLYEEGVEEIKISINDSKEVKIYWTITQFPPEEWDNHVPMIPQYFNTSSSVYRGFVNHLVRTYPHFRDHILKGIQNARNAYVSFYNKRNELQIQYESTHEGVVDYYKHFRVGETLFLAPQFWPEEKPPRMVYHGTPTGSTFIATYESSEEDSDLDYPDSVYKTPFKKEANRGRGFYRGGGNRRRGGSRS